MKRTAGAGIIFAAVLLLMPLATFAQSKPTFLIKPIVPAECRCDNQKNASDGTTLTTAPDFGCVMQVVQNSINHGVSLAGIIFTIYIVIAGFAFVTARDSSEAISKAKTRITNVFIGLIVLLLAWLLVDYIMKTVYDSNSTFFGPWNTILAEKPDGSDRCIVAKNPSILATKADPSAGLTSAGPDGTGGANDGSGSAAGGSSGLDKAKA
ncbi:MAG: hypothetical protein JWL75_586, partial [Parcubacteria group bacterium]|nr:hypothetical protein [Parcubacteria group bacterium]